MLLLRIGIICFLLTIINCNVNNTVSDKEIISYQSENRTLLKQKIKKAQRTVLIINESEALRSKGVNRDKIESLLYQEYDKDKMLNQYWMYNLKDVAGFFETYLDTELCYGTCKND